MSGSVRVEPALLHLSADHLDQHRADHTATHTKTNGEIEAASAGWVGTSAKALQAKITDWAGQSLHVDNELTHYRDAFTKCGYGFSDTDEHAKADFFRIREYLGAVNFPLGT